MGGSVCIHKDINEIIIDTVVRHDLPDTVTYSELLKATENDTSMTKLKIAIKRGYVLPGDKELLKEYLQVFKELSSGKGLILRGDRLVIPKSLTNKIVALAHEGHQGEVKTKQLIRATMWFPGIDKLVKDIVKQCLPCQAVVDSKQAEPLKVSTMPEGPWQKLNTDLFGPLPSGDYILAVQCQYSRFPVVEIIRSTSANCIIPVLDEIFSSFGIPDSLGTDNGPPFSSAAFSNFARYLGFQHKKKIPLAPWANGMIERFNKSLGKVVRTAQVEGQNWKQELQKFLRAYRSTPHSMTGLTPAELLFNGRIYKTRLPVPQKRTMLVKKAQACMNDAKSKLVMKKNADSKAYVKMLNIKEGDTVLCRQEKVNKLSTPFNPKPMTVTKVKGSLIEAENKDKRICRHVTFFKKLDIERSEGVGEDFEVNKQVESREGGLNQNVRIREGVGSREAPGEEAEAVADHASERESYLEPRRSGRQSRRPDRYADYETSYST